MWILSKFHVERKISIEKRERTCLVEELTEVNLTNIVLSLVWIMVQETMIGVTDFFLKF
jgi:hypothetical protein